MDGCYFVLSCRIKFLKLFCDEKFVLASFSVTRWLNYFFIFWQFTTMKVCPIAKIFPKLGSKVCQSLNEPLKVDQNIPKIAKLDQFRQI